MKVYRISNGWRIFATIFLLLGIALFVWLFINSFTKEPQSLFLSVLWVAMLILCIVGLIDTHVFKLILDNNSIKKTNILGTKELAFKDIQGVRINDKYVYVIPKNESAKTISISTYIEDCEIWTSWLLSHFENLDENEYASEVKELYENVKFGRTQEERDRIIEKAELLTKVLNYVSIITSIWFLISPNPYNILTIINIMMPIIGLIIVFLYNGLIRIIKTDNSPYPTLSSCLTMPVAVIMIRVLLDYDIVDYSSLWVPSILLSTITVYIIIKSNNSEFKVSKTKELIILYFYLSIGVGVFVFFSIILTNCTFDYSEPIEYQTKIVEKRISSGRRTPTRYLIKIEKWSDEYNKNLVSIVKNSYEEMKVGEVINVYLNKGLLGVPWIFVEKRVSSNPTDSSGNFYVDMVGTVLYENRDTANDYLIYVELEGDTIKSYAQTESKFDIPLILGRKYKFGFNKKGYIPKHLIVDVIEFGDYEDYKYGFEFPMEIILLKSDIDVESKEVAYIRYYKETGYIDYHLDSNLIKHE